MKFAFALIPALFVMASAQAIEVGETLHIGKGNIQCTDIPASSGGGRCSYCYGGYGYGYGRNPVSAHAELNISVNTEGVTSLTGEDTSCAAFNARLTGDSIAGVVVEKDVKDLGSVKSIFLGVRLGGKDGPVLNGYGEI